MIDGIRTGYLGHCGVLVTQLKAVFRHIFIAKMSLNEKYKVFVIRFKYNSVPLRLLK